MKVLVVDDTSVVRDLIAAALQLMQVEVDTAASLSEAFERLSSSHDFAMVDTNLADGKGLRLLDYTLALGVPFIAMSGDTDSITDAEATAGVAAVLPKPFELATLRELVQRHSRNRTLPRFT